MFRGTVGPTCAFNPVMLASPAGLRAGGKRPHKLKGAAMRSLAIRTYGMLLALSTVALGQGSTGIGEALPPHTGFAIVPSTIAYIPPLAQAVLTGDPGQVSKELGASDGVNAAIRAKEGERAGFTPLILAAALPTPDIAEMLIKSGANVSALDDYRRSAVWYAALRDSPSTVRILTAQKDVGKVINVADADLKRTPLHLAVRGNSPEVVSLLLKAGAAPSKEQKDILEQTPVDFCKDHLTGGCKALDF